MTDGTVCHRMIVTVTAAPGSRCLVWHAQEELGSRGVCLGGWVSSEAVGVASPDYLVRTVELKKSRGCGLEQGYKKQETTNRENYTH